MSVELSPQELGFRRPFTQEVTQVLQLGNPNDNPVIFKVKTTAPKSYCVRPNSGRIEPGSQVEVQVLLQAMKEDPPLDAKCRDRFLVQSVAVTPDADSSSLGALWQTVEQTAKGSIQEKKIRVTWLPPDGRAVTPVHNHINGVMHDTPGSESQQYRSPSPDIGVHSAPRPAAEGQVSLPQERPEGSKHLGDALASAHNPAAPSENRSSIYATAQGVAQSVSNAVPTSTEDVKAQLAEAKATIARLTQQAQEQVLRQRKSDAVNQDSRERISGGTTGMGVQQQPAQGVPVQIVAGLCLLSFLLAYFLF